MQPTDPKRQMNSANTEHLPVLMLQHTK